MNRKYNYIWVIPILVIIIIFTILPLIISFKDAFVNDGDFGFASFTKIFSDSLFLRAYVNSVIYLIAALISIPLSLYISFALIGVANKYLRNTFSIIIFLQYIFLGLAISSGYIFIFKTDYGLFNMLLNLLGTDNISFLNNPSISVLTVSLISILNTLPFLVTVFTFRGLTYIRDKEDLIVTNKIDLRDCVITKSILVNMKKFIFLTTYFILVQGFLSYPVGLYSGDLGAIFVAKSQSLVCYINRSINLGNYSNASACSIVSMLSIFVMTLIFYLMYLVGGKYA